MIALLLLVCPALVLALNMCANLEHAPGLYADTNLLVPPEKTQIQHELTLMQCGIRCLNWRRCKSIDYKPLKRKCYLNKLNSSDLSPIKFISQREIIHSSIYSWPKSLAGQCEHHSCPTSSYCDVTADNSTVCLTFVLD